MSFDAIKWAVDQKLPCPQKMVLLMLASHTNGHTGRCDPSLVRLADECGMSRDSLINQIKRLESSKKLTVIREKDGEINLRNKYKLHFDEGGSSSQRLGGVVAQNDQGSNPMPLGVVAQNDPKQEVKTGNKSNALAIKPPTPPKKPNSLKKRFDKHISGMPESWRKYCEEKRPGLNADEIYEDFSDHWLASAKPEASKMDWDAAFRWWVRKQFKTPREIGDEQQRERQKYML